MADNRPLVSIVAGLFACGCGRVDTEVGEQPSSVYIEAPAGSLSGFSVQDDPDAGAPYILPPEDAASLSAPGGASAMYGFILGRAGLYNVWGRIRSPGALNNALWVTVDSGPTYIWHLSTGVAWFWGRVTSGTDYTHPIVFSLAAGPHRIVFRNAEPDVGLSRIYVAPAGQVPPGNDTPCDPPNSIELADGGCEVSCGSHGPGVTCGPPCAGQPALVAYDCQVCCLAPEAGVAGGTDGATTRLEAAAVGTDAGPADASMQ